MRVYFRSFILAAFALLTINMTAATLDAPSAQVKANQFLNEQHAVQLRSTNVSLRLAYAEASAVAAHCADYYVFNTSDDAAFIIVAGDDRAEQILGYGEGTLDMANLPCNLKWWLDQYKEQMEYLLANPDEKVEIGAALNDDESIVIAPMLTCNWSQSEPYYNQCPIYQGERCVTGCVATAMAQVMYFWRYPDHVSGLSSYWCRSINSSVSALPATTLEWDDMIDSYAGEYTTQQANAVAKLMRYCGQSCNMSYSPTGSGSYVQNQLRGMKHFGYNPNAVMLDRTNYTSEEWKNLVLEDLCDGYPVLYSGNDPMAGGHAFVLDGYIDGKFHINWGWAATGNGYFALGAFNVRSYAFNALNQILHRIYPSQMSAPELGSDFVQNGIYYKYNEEGTEAIVTYFDTQYDSYEGDVVIPAQVTHGGTTLPVTGIGNSAFRNSLGLVSVTIPSSVKHIDDYAFRNCLGLVEIEIPLGVETIGNQVFTNCLNLERVDFKGSVKTIGDDAFRDCAALNRVEVNDINSWLGISFVNHYSNPLSYAHHLYVNGQDLEHLVVPGSIDAVSQFAFIECTGLKSLTVQEGVGNIGTSAFSNCTELVTVSLPQSMTTIGKQVFNCCTAMTDVEIPETITSIGYAAFSECVALKNLVLPASLKTLEGNAFYNCKGLTEVVLPNSVTDVGASAFYGCSALTNVTLSTSMQTLNNNVFSGCSKLSHIDIPSSVNTISSGAFQKCSSLTKVFIPDGVTQLGEQAFYQCIKLSEVTIGRNVQSVGPKAFYNCMALTAVTCQGENPPETPGNAETFTMSVYESAVLYVPATAYHAYKNSGIWPWFKHIETIIDTIPGDVNGDGEVNISDVSAIIDIQLSSANDIAADVNADGEVNITDINAVIDIILSGN